jgi:hypothetical protein
LAEQIRRVGATLDPAERSALEWSLVRDTLTGWLPKPTTRLRRNRLGRRWRLIRQRAALPTRRSPRT